MFQLIAEVLNDISEVKATAETAESTSRCFDIFFRYGNWEYVTKSLPSPYCHRTMSLVSVVAWRLTML